jgi:glycogen(starch) synthase
VIHNGVDDPGLPSLPLPFSPPHVLCVGRLVRQKAFDVVIDAMPELRRDHPALRLTIVGDGESRAELEEQARRLGVASSVTFAGSLARASVFAVLNRATMVVMPSRGAEGLPLVALESALVARPIVATRSGGLSEAVVDGRTGFLVESGDQRALEAAINRILHDPALATRLGRAGQEQVLKVFSSAAHVARYDALYRTLTESLRRHGCDDGSTVQQ